MFMEWNNSVERSVNHSGWTFRILILSIVSSNKFEAHFEKYCFH